MRTLTEQGSGTLCDAMMLPDLKSAFRARLWPKCYRESTGMGPPADLRPAGGTISVLSRWQSGQNPAREADFRPGSTIV